MQYLNLRKQVILDLGFPEEKFESLSSYLDFLWLSNEELNLFSRQMSFEDLVDNHVIDCLLALPELPKDLKKIADFGSGGGLPGVLFALARPKTQVYLFEKSPKKRIYLARLAESIQNIRIEGLITEELSGFDLVTARAFKPIDVILDLSRKFYGSGGKYFLLKGRTEKIQEELELAQKKFKTLKIQTINLHSPVVTDTQRNLVLINF